MTDVSRMTDAELLALYKGAADVPAPDAQPVAQSRTMPGVAGMSDQQLLALHAMPPPARAGAAEAVVTGLAQGMTFGYADEIGGALRGGVPGMFNGKGFQQGYTEERDRLRARDKVVEEERPWITTGAKIAGNVAGLAPAITYAPGFMGVAGATLPGRIGMSVASGGLVGGAQGLGEGEGDAKAQGLNALVGAGGGAVFGAAAPIAGHLVGRAARPIMQRFTNRSAPVPGVGNTGADILLEDFERAGGAAGVRGALSDLGENARLYHAGPSFEGSAQGLAVRPETRELVTNDVRGLRAGANDRLAADVDAALGPAPVPSQIEAQFKAKRDALSPLYERELAAARPLGDNEAVALWDLAESLARDQKGVGRGILNDAIDLVAPPVRTQHGMMRRPDTSPEGLMATRKALDGMMARVDESAQLQREGVGMKLQQLRQAVDDQVRGLNPEIKNLDRAYETFSDASAGLRSGLNFTARDVHPFDVAARFNAAPMEQQAAERLGARARIDTEMGSTNRDLVKLRDTIKTEGKRSNEKAGTYFGRDAVDKVERAVDREGAFEETARRIVDNSMTEPRRQAAARFEPRGEKAADQTMAISTIGGPKAMMLAALVRAGKSANTEANRLVDIGRNEEVGRALLTRAGTPEMEAIIDALSRRASLAGAGEVANDNLKRVVEALIRANGNEAAQYGRRAMAR